MQTDASPLVVRVVSRKRFIFPAEQALRELYGSAYAHEFPYLSNAIFLFQQIGGRDVLLFAMYVQEYGPDCPEPNRNRVYISYLDSVRYFQSTPDGHRTSVYHSILLHYLDYTKRAGYEHAHIWVSPPKQGDDYIFYARTPHGGSNPRTKQHAGFRLPVPSLPTGVGPDAAQIPR